MRLQVRGACPLDCPDTCSWIVRVENGEAVTLRGETVDARDPDMGGGAAHHDSRVPADRVS